MRHLLPAVQAALRPRYVVVREVGRGSMASVFSAWDSDRDREVAIKVLRPEFVATLVGQRFHREIDYLADLDHPNILATLDSGESGGLVYFTMPLAPGDTLASQMSKEGPLRIERAVAITRDIAAAIDHAHARNIIHRDIKPANIVFAESRAMICDFGIARAIVTAGKERISSSGLVVGTPEYMSPEQASGQWELSGAADIYALGCLVFMMLAGEPPFTGSTAQSVMAKHVSAPIPSLRVVSPEVPADIERAVTRALAKTAADRPANAAELASELAAAR